MKQVWKFPLPMTDLAQIEMPLGSKCIHVDCQDGVPMVWAVVIPDAPKTVRWFRVAGTGHPIVSIHAARHLGSFQMADGRLVFHVFEIADPGNKPPEEGAGDLKGGSA